MNHNRNSIMASRTNLEYCVSELKRIYQKVKGDEELVEIFQAKDQVIQKFQTMFSRANLTHLSREDFYSFLSFEENKHWSHLYRQQRAITSDMKKLREGLAVLVDEGRPLAERLDFLRPPSGDPFIKGLSKAIITPILLIMFPEKYGVWNGTSVGGMKALNVWPKITNSMSFSERYIAINDTLVTLSRMSQFDLWDLDAIWWAVGSHTIQAEESTPKIEEEIEDYEAVLANGFSIEKYLQSFLYENWDQIDVFSEWSIYQEDDEDIGVEFGTNIGRIDILAKHKFEPKWLVIELKRNQASDTTMGQIQRYMGWVKKNLASPNEEVTGLIIAKTMSEKLKYALEMSNIISFSQYDVSFSLSKPTKK